MGKFRDVQGNFAKFAKSCKIYAKNVNFTLIHIIHGFFMDNMDNMDK